MRAAGINPILAGKYDASTPAGSMAMFESISAGASAGANTAVAARKTESDVQKQEAEIEQIGLQNKLTAEQTGKLGQEIHKLKTEIRILEHESFIRLDQRARSKWLTDYYAVNGGDFIAKDMGVTQIKLIEMIESYITKYLGEQ